MSILNSKDEDERLAAILYCDRFEKLLDRIGKTKEAEQDLQKFQELATEQYGVPKKAVLSSMFTFFAFGFDEGVKFMNQLSLLESEAPKERSRNAK